MSINENKNISLNKMCRAKGLATALNISVATVWRWTKEGKIKSHKISNGTTLFNIDEVMNDLGIVVEHNNEIQ